jgi:ferredoxin-fold anticodon binding domain-containing protein
MKTKSTKTKTTKTATKAATGVDALIGKKILLRCYYAGVHAGVLKSCTDNYLWIDGYRLWSWEAETGVSLSEVATRGLRQSSSNKVCALVSLGVRVSDVYEILEISDNAFETIKKQALA